MQEHQRAGSFFTCLAGRHHSAAARQFPRDSGAGHTLREKCTRAGHSRATWNVDEAAKRCRFAGLRAGMTRVPDTGLSRSKTAW